MLPTLKIVFERWKFNPKYNLYVSTEGRVKTKDGEPKKVRTGSDGYLSVSFINENGKTKYVFLHRLVLSTWKPREDMEQLTVDHLNHNKRDNSLSNLEWVSKEENLLRAEKDRISSKEYAKLCYEEFNTTKRIIFQSHKRIVCFNTLEEAVSTAFVFCSNVSNRDIVEEKICKSIKYGGKAFGGYWAAE